MKGIIILFFAGILSYSKPSSAQTKDSSYYKGNLPLINKTIQKILRKLNPETDSAYSMLAIIEINTKGKLENLLMSSFKSSLFSDTIYNILLATKNDWVNNTDRNLFFELPIYILHVFDNNKKDTESIVTTMLYHEGEMVNSIKLGPIICQIFPAVSAIDSCGEAIAASD